MEATVEWPLRVANLHIIGPGRSVMLPEVVGHVSLYLHRALTPEKKTIKESYSVHGV